MAHSVIEAIKQGIWDYEPEPELPGEFPETDALPGTDQKLEVLATRIERGLPLWHPRDRRSYSASEE